MQPRAPRRLPLPRGPARPFLVGPPRNPGPRGRPAARRGTEGGGPGVVAWSRADRLPLAVTKVLSFPFSIPINRLSHVYVELRVLPPPARSRLSASCGLSCRFWPWSATRHLEQTGALPAATGVLPGGAPRPAALGPPAHLAGFLGFPRCSRSRSARVTYSRAASRPWRQRPGAPCF